MYSIIQSKCNIKLSDSDHLQSTLREVKSEDFEVQCKVELKDEPLDYEEGYKL